MYNLPLTCTISDVYNSRGLVALAYCSKNREKWPLRYVKNKCYCGINICGLVKTWSQPISIIPLPMPVLGSSQLLSMVFSHQKIVLPYVIRNFFKLYMTGLRNCFRFDLPYFLSNSKWNKWNEPISPTPLPFSQIFVSSKSGWDVFMPFHTERADILTNHLTNYGGIWF